MSENYRSLALKKTSVNSALSSDWRSPISYLPIIIDLVIYLGAMYIFNKLMKIGSLEIGLGDYLGTYNITSLSPLICFAFYAVPLLVLLSLFLFCCSNRGNIFCYRFCLYLAGMKQNLLNVLFIINTFQWPYFFKIWSLLQVLNQDETPLLYSLVFGEGVVNDATSVVLFNAIQSFDLSAINSKTAFQFIGNFLYLFISSTLLGVLVINFPLLTLNFFLLSWYLVTHLCFINPQAGLLSAYIIKKLYFGRFVESGWCHYVNPTASKKNEIALMKLNSF